MSRSGKKKGKCRLSRVRLSRHSMSRWLRGSWGVCNLALIVVSEQLSEYGHASCEWKIVGTDLFCFCCVIKWKKDEMWWTSIIRQSLCGLNQTTAPERFLNRGRLGSGEKDALSRRWHSAFEFPIYYPTRYLSRYPIIDFEIADEKGSYRPDNFLVHSWYFYLLLWRATTNRTS